LETTKININDYDFEPIKKLLLAIRNDPLINKKVTSILKMDAYPRRFVLNNWLEQLHRKNAPEQLTNTLLYLFDDVIAQKVFTLVNRKES